MIKIHWQALIKAIESFFVSEKEHKREYALKTIYTLLWCKKLLDCGQIRLNSIKLIDKTTTTFQSFVECFIYSSTALIPEKSQKWTFVSSFFLWLKKCYEQYPGKMEFIIDHPNKKQIKIEMITFKLPWWTKNTLDSFVSMKFPESEQNCDLIVSELKKLDTNEEIIKFLDSPNIEMPFLRELLFPDTNRQKDLGAYYTPPQMVSYLTRKVLFQKMIEIFESAFVIEEKNTIKQQSQMVNKKVWEKIQNAWIKEKKYSQERFISPLEELLESDQKVNMKSFLSKKLLEFKILDPACGDGNFLVEYFIQRNKWQKILSPDQIHDEPKRFQDLFGIFGIDIDPNAILTCQFRLFLLIKNDSKSDGILDGTCLKNHFYMMEPLTDNPPKDIPKIDIVLSNPPYMNLIENPQIRKKLEKNFTDIYHGKLDLCYYFLPKILELLNQNGICGIVLKRYFFKSPVARNLRKFLLQFSSIQEILDFGNLQMFQEAGIETLTCIFTSKRHDQSSPTKPTTTYYSLMTDFPPQEPFLETSIATFYQFNLELFPDRWDFSPNPIIGKFEKPIMEYTWNDYGKNLDKIFTFDSKIPLFILVKGIQTGKDQVFIVDSTKDLESQKTARFIKGQHIAPFVIQESGLQIILSHRYSPIISASFEKSKYPKIQAYLEANRSILEGRSRAQGSAWAFWRKGDERNTVDFQLPKLVWPYRGPKFYCAIDRSGAYHSQDVILMTINKKLWKEHIPLDAQQQFFEIWSNEMIYFYLGLFNSAIFEKYLFGHAKEFAIHVKDFQPNNFKDLNIPFYNPKDTDHQLIMKYGKELEELMKQQPKTTKPLNLIQQKLDDHAKKIFHLE